MVALIVASTLRLMLAGPRNVILIVVDTLRADRLGSYGYGRGTTPNLDAFAAAGTRFANARAQASCTFPSINSLFTSRYPQLFLEQETGELGIPDRLPTLAEILRDHGLTTFAASASPIVRQTPTRYNRSGGFDRGFDNFNERCLWQDASCVNRQLLAALGELEEPFFAYAHYMDPHGPYQPPANAPRLFARPAPSLPEVVQRGDPTAWTKSLRDGATPPDRAELRHLSDLYDDEIAYLDRELGTLLADVEERGLLDRTLVIIASDHGEEFLEHGAMKHCENTFDTTVHTPLIIRAGDASGAVAQAVQNLDIAPTVLDYLGIAPPDGLKGRSLRPFIDKGFFGALSSLLSPGPPHRGAAFSIQGLWRSAVREQHKAQYRLDTREILVYDLESDPAEEIPSSEMNRQQRELVRELQAWTEELEGDDADESLRRSLEAQDRLRATGYL